MLAAALLLAAPAHADRPTDGTGLFAYDAADVIEHVDGPAGIVRVHYSVEGPNVTRLDDDDGSGAPDFPEMVAATAEDVLVFYADLGFRAPLSESAVGLGALGGSDAFDFYLVDFGGNADGNFAIDACVGDRCAGHMNMENDFRGYGYPSLSAATAILTSHELFHAVQAAYRAGQPGWLSEGTAVWGTWIFDPTTYDMAGFGSAYLDDSGRSIDRPPAGVATAFSYGTALFFAFLHEHLDPTLGVALQEALEGTSEGDETAVIAAVIADYGAELAGEWATFAQWNLATGRRAGAADSYSFADDLGGVTFEDDDAGTLDDDNRFYPLAATYYRWTHDGGAANFVAFDDPTGLVFSLHPLVDGLAEPPVATWTPTSTDAEALGALPAGDYALVGTYPEIADQSVKVAFCLGPPTDCVAPVDEADPDDAAQGDAGGKGGEAGGCAAAPGPGSALLALLALPVVARRRRT